MAINVPLNAQLQNATQLQQQIQNAVNAVRINLGGPNGARALSSLSQPLGRLTGQADEFTKSLDAANARVLAFGASVGVVNAVTNAFKSLVNSTIEVEKAITAISVVGDQFAGKTKELSQGLFSIAKATGQSFSEVSKAALEFSRQGLALEDTLSRTQDALVLTRLTGLDAAKSVDGLTAAVNAFSKAGLSTTQIINKLAAVDQAFAVSSADLIEGFNRSAAVAQNAGVTFDELAGIITALQQETSRGGSVIGNALKTIFTRLQDTSTLNQLQNLGIAVQDLQGNILPARQILQNLAKDVEGLGQITKAGIFKDVAGNFQINQLISLVGDLNKENSVAAAATLKSASATDQAYIANEKLNQSLDAILNKVATTGKQLGSILGELGLTDNLKGLLDGINSFLEGANSLLQGDDLGSRFAKGFVKGIGSVLTGPGLGIFLAIIAKLSFDLLKFGTQSLKTFFGIGKAAADQKQVQESIVQTLLKNQNVLNSILNTQGGQNAQALKFLGLLNQQAAAMQAIQGLAGGIASTVYAGGYRATPGGLQRKAAGGYLPAQEASDVRRGVGGASPSSKVVAIPNFAFGGGKRGTMIANTSEYIVPNYAGGGSAIFNQDMVKTMGLPPGARKISAAGGFVPNFAIRGLASNIPVLAGRVFESLIRNDKYIDLTENLIQPDIPKGKPYGEAEAKLSVKAALNDINFGPDRPKGNKVVVPKDASKEFDKQLEEKKGSQIIRAKSDKFLRNNIFRIARTILENESLKQSTYSKIPLNASSGYVPNFANYVFDSDKLPSGSRDFIKQLKSSSSNFEMIREAKTNQDLAVLGLYGKNGAINGSPVYTLQSQRPELFKDINKNLQKNVTNLVQAYAARIGKSVGIPVVPKNVEKSLNQLPSVAGFMFEDVLNQLAGPDFDSNRISGGSRADFPLNRNLRKVFGATGSQKYAEVKLNPYTADAVSSILSKQKALAGGALGPQSIAGDKINEFKARAIALGIGQGGRVDTKTQSQRNALIKELISAGIIKSGYGTSADQNKAIKRALGIASGGYVPNFAAAALQQAIAREKRAGLSDSQIYVDQSTALKSPMNPMGLMVANRRDEPTGGFQGIARARKEGVNPKLYGAANGFVPNFGAGLSGYAANLNAQSSAPNPNNTEAVNKGFADTAGKIFLLQSALSFLQGAVGDTEDSFSKITNAFASASGNVTSLVLLGKEIQGINIEANGMKGALGKLAKGAGLAGVAIGVAVEAYGFANFAIKEFSGENAKAALASAKLADASDKLSLKFESLSKTRQIEITTNVEKMLGSQGFEGFWNGVANLFREEKKGGGDIGGDPEIKKAAAQLMASGATEKEIIDIIKKGQPKPVDISTTEKLGATTLLGFAPFMAPFFKNVLRPGAKKDVTQRSDILAEFEKEQTTGLGKQLDEKLRSFRTALSSIDVSTKKGREEALKKGREIYGDKPNTQQQKLIDEEIKASQDLNKTKQEEQKAQNALNFGERLNLELAKQRLDSVFQLKQLSEESLTPAERFLQFQLETLDLSNKEKILKEAQLKNLDLERKKRIDILSATKSVVDQASQGGLSVNTEDLDQLTTFLQDNLGKSTEELSQKLQDTFKLPKDQADNLLKSLKQQTKNIEASTNAQKKLNNEATNLKLRVDTANSSLQNQLNIFQRIAQVAESISNLNISSTNVQIGVNEAEISRLEALAADPTLTQGQQDAYRKQVIDLQKRNNELKKGNELSQFEAKQAGILAQQAEKRKLLEKVSPKNTEERVKLQTEIDNLGRQLATELNNYNASTAAIDANNKVLDIQALLIGKVTGAYASYRQQLEAFRLGAGGRVGTAMLDELGATDINSLMQARIKQNVEADASGLNDKDRYKFVQEETRLRQIQFDLATAESATRRRELEYEKKYTQEIIDLKNQGASDQELIDARNRQILEQRSGARGFEKGLDTIQDRINNYRSTLGEEIPNLFSSNLAQGLNDAISGAKDLKTALTDAATAFFQEITRKNISNLADLVTGGLGKVVSGGGNKEVSGGGGIFSSILSFFGGNNKASGGMIKGGSGTKDDVPAMLMGGEYVMKKSAVNKYGKGFLDALNNGKMRGYATGGLVDPQTFPTQTGRGGFFTPGDYGQGAITGKNELLTFASQSFTGGQYDYMGGFGMGGASVGLEPESARLSSFGRENSPMFERVQQSKDEAFKVYLEGLQKEKEYADLLDQIAKDKKARKKQLQTAIISAVVSSAASYAGSSIKTGVLNAKAAGGSKLSGAFVGQSGRGGLFNSFRGTGTTLTDSAKALQYAKIAPLISGGGFTNPLLPLPHWMDNALPNQKRATGGLISGGSNIRDDVPAMLTGGEFVLNNRATKNLGLQKLNQLNNGQPADSGTASADITQALISKLDELIQATQNSSSDNVVVNVSTSEAGGQNQENSTATEKDLGKKIRQAVLDVIAQEKRLGGSLEKAR